jgi:hypothetical protein
MREGINKNLSKCISLQKSFFASHEFERNWVRIFYFHFWLSMPRIFYETFRKTQWEKTLTKNHSNASAYRKAFLHHMNLKETEIEYFTSIFVQACWGYFARLLGRHNERRHKQKNHSNASAYRKAFFHHMNLKETELEYFTSIFD